MNTFDSELQAAARLAIAALIGLAVGLEREWSGGTAGAKPRFAGLRTFFLIGLLGGAAGLLIAESYRAVGAVLAAGGSALAVAAYIMSTRHADAEADGTTEAASLVVIALGTLAGIGWLWLAAGSASIVVVALHEKTRLHWLVRRVGEVELGAALQFAALAIVVLPILPRGPFFGPLDVRPRALWGVVLLLSGLNFLGYLARRALGAQHGYGITGAIGGLVSSTAVTLSFSRQSRRDPALARSLASGVIAACTVLLPRVLVVSAALNPAVALALVPPLIPPFIAGAATTALLVFGPRSESAPAAQPSAEDSRSPLRLAAAIRMALLFQIGIALLAFVQSAWGTRGVYTTAAVLGLTDVDALNVSMSRSDSGLAPSVAAHAVAIGVIANTVLKLGVALVLGSARFRRVAGLALAGLAAAAALGLWLL